MKQALWVKMTLRGETRAPKYIEVVLLAAAVALCASIAAADATQASLTWRQNGVLSGAAIAEKTASYAGAVGASQAVLSTRTQQGLLEIRPAAGTQVVATNPWGAACPVITGPMDVASGAAFDLPIRWVYETDNLVTGQPFAELGQTFIATGSELSKIACFIATGPDTFDITIRKEGPTGEQVGPAARFKTTAEQSMGLAQWQPGQVSLEVGKAYYVGIKSRSGKPFGTYLHSTGDVYPTGCAYYNGIPEPGSDLGLLIALQDDSAIRSSVLYSTRGDGWVLHTKGIYFKARSSNIRAAYIRLKDKDLPQEFDAVIRCSKLNLDATVTRVGPEKTCRASASGDGFEVAAVYGPDELPVEPGKTYYLEVTPKGDGLPADDPQALKVDLLVDVYGEKTPGMTPVIYNQKITTTTSTSVGLAWNGAADCKTTINYGLTPYDLRFVTVADKGRQAVDIHPIRPGTTFCFKITAESATGGRFETPVYQARTLDAEGKPVTDPLLVPAPEGFLSLAPMDYLIEEPAPPTKGFVPVEVPNSGFEQGLREWQVSPARTVVEWAYSGKTSVGWFVLSSVAKPSKESTIYQTVKVVPGRTYVLSACLLTDQDLAATSLWARLVCDPKGGTDFTGADSTQWFRTGGRWMRFSKSWKAESSQMTIGVGFTRGNGQFTAALADSITLSEVKEPSFWHRIIGR